MAQNIYTTQFATKAELNSEISQTATSINLSVDSKLSNYSTTNEMNSAISVSASGVESRVSQIYETKDNATTQYSSINQDIDEVNIEVGKKYNTSDFTGANIMLAVNNDSSSATINANKISLARKTN